MTYEATKPQQAAQVLNTLVNLYMEKHMAVHQPAGTFEFFQKQTQQFEKDWRKPSLAWSNSVRNKAWSPLNKKKCPRWKSFQNSGRS